MAEGVRSGILGDEDEKPELEASNTLAGAEAFASAVAAKLAGNDPGVVFFRHVATSDWISGGVSSWSWRLHLSKSCAPSAGACAHR